MLIFPPMAYDRNAKGYNTFFRPDVGKGSITGCFLGKLYENFMPIFSPGGFVFV